MPTTPKGIYYPGPKFPAQISADMAQMGGQAVQKTSYLRVSTFNPTETITAPTSYTPSVGQGNGEAVDLTVPSGSGFEPVLWLSYMAQWKKTVSGATTSAAIFLNVNGAGSTQLKKINSAGGAPVVQEVVDSAAGTNYGFLYVNKDGIQGTAGGGVDTDVSAPNGFVMPEGVQIWGLGQGGGSIHIEIKFKASSGNIILGQRYLVAGYMAVA
jgi:hypothetical protein